MQARTDTQPTEQVTDKDLAAIKEFVVIHRKTLAYRGDVTTINEVTSIDPKHMSFMSTGFKTSTPDRINKQEFIFDWSQLNRAFIFVDKNDSDLHIELRPQGVMRVFLAEERVWRRGTTPAVEFSLNTQSDAEKFFGLLSVAAKKFGAKNLSASPRILDEREPAPMTPERKAWLDKTMKSIHDDPGQFDRNYPRENPAGKAN